MKRRSHKSPAASPANSAASIGVRLQRLWLVWLAALLVATPLIPSEAAAAQGSGIVLVMLWLVMLVAWCTAKVLRKDYTLHAGWTVYVFAIFLVLIVTSAMVMLARGHPRPMINTVWQWLSFGIAFFLCQEVIRTHLQRRAVVAIMLALAVCLAVDGFYQVLYSMPKTRRDYEANPDAALAAAGIVAPPDSTARWLFEQRLYSTEPLATFTLTNSLAGFLSPWLLIAIGIAWTSWRDAQPRWRTAAGMACCTFLIAGCWVLTKSRSACLATTFGLGLLVAIQMRRTGWRRNWPVAASLVAAPVLLAFFGVLLGGLDMLVLTETAKSARYRVEYWQATGAMIADYPWLGCGPGNFQQYYTAHKLPAASETIADPHNFLLEVWATTGTPAAIGLLALLLVFAWQVRRSWQAGAAARTGESARAAPRQSATSVAAPALAPAATGSDADAWFVYLGAGIGALIAFFPCGFLVGFMPDWSLFLIPFPLAIVALVVCHGWVRHGRLDLSLLLCGIVVLLVNLSAAGGIAFAGVSLTLWLLMALTLSLVEDGKAARPRSRPLVGCLAAGAWLLLIVCHQTAYDPILRAGALLAEGNTARQFGRFEHAEETFERAAAADPFSFEPWLQLAQLRYEHWLRTATPDAREAFDEAVANMLLRNPRSNKLRQQVGHWQLTSYRFHNRAEDLQGAITSYREANALYPRFNLGHADAAWAYFLAGEQENAQQEAEEALRLNGLNPHQEQHLVGQSISDPGPVRFPHQPRGPAENAEQTMLFLRTLQGPNDAPTDSHD